MEINTRASAILERPAEQILSHRLEEFACADDGPKLTRWLEWELLSPLLVGAVRKGKGSVALWLQQHGHFIYRGRRVCMTLIDTGECPAGIGAKTDCLLLKATDLGYLNWKHYEASPKKQWSG